MLTGQPQAILEGSIISAKRTAASAALAARSLHPDKEVESVSLIGCGLINFEIQRFLLNMFPSIKKMYLYDLKAERSAQFKQICENTFGQVSAEVITSLDDLLASSNLISIATTAIKPYITDISAFSAGSTVLHISLRDLAPEVILACDNVVDDADHVCRAQTSIHLAEQLAGTRDFIRCSIADVTSGAAPARRDDKSVAVFSPFGLGILDIAVSNLAYTTAIRSNQGTVIKSFLPDSWVERV
jgi:ornithine cyclodeaminase